MRMTGVRSFAVSNGSVLVERNVRGNLQIVQQQRVTVGRGIGDAVGADDRSAASDVFDDDTLLQFLRKRLRNHARGFISRSAGRIGHDNRDSAARILLC